MRHHSTSIGILLLLIILIGVCNIVPGTFLTGWDNLHPEFNLFLNIERSFFAVWQEYQGVGLLGGMGHASELVHQLILLLFSIVVPQNMLRYVYTLLMLLVGAIGMYVFVLHVEHSRITALIGSIFYVLNLATLQLFFVPLEVFTTQFGFLPWIFAMSYKYVNNPSKKHLGLLLLVLLLSTPQAYVPTVFLISFAALFVLLFVWFLYKKTLTNAKRICIVFLFVFLMNAFWILPFLYFFSTSRTIPVHAKINEMTTENIFLQNREFGFLPDVMLLKSYLFNDIDPGLGGNNLMMHTWRDHLANPFMWLIGLLFFAFILYGSRVLWRKNTPLARGCVVLFVISFAALATATPPFSWINSLIRDHVPIIGQAYRFPFTKFGILAGLSYSVLFAIGVKQIVERIGTNQFLHTTCYLLLATLLFLYTLPTFTGNFFYEKERLSIPKEYFDLFNFFSHQNPNTRIANLPQYTYWSWEFYRWGYSGSGFPWYGIPQPMMDRTFDPWSFYNETYYDQLSHAIFSQDPKKIEHVLNKYQISWITVDKNQYNPEYPLLFINPNIDTLLSQIPDVHKVQTFGKIAVYKFSPNEHPKSFVFLTPPLPHTNAGATLDDVFYQSFGTYIADTMPTPQTNFFPFASLGMDNVQFPFSITENNKSVVFSADIPTLTANQTLHVPDTLHQTLPFSLTVIPPQQSTSFALTANELPAAINPGDNSKLSIQVQKITKEYTSATITPSVNNTLSQNCDPIRKGTTAVEKTNSLLRISSYNATVCATYTANFLSHSQGYVVSIPVKHIAGRGLHFWISNDKENFSLMDTYLPEKHGLQTYTFVIPPLEPFSASYAVRLANISIGNEQTINDIGKITITPIPYDFLKQLYFSNTPPPQSEKIEQPTTITHPNPSLYVLSVSSQQLQSHPVVVLSQGFDTGWKAYKLQTTSYQLQNFFYEAFPFLFGKEINNHVIINNWENGWVLPNHELLATNYQLPTNNAEPTLILLYLPQYLEYLGFILLLIPIAVFLKMKHIRT